jgi:hypothetical protein
MRTVRHVNLGVLAIQFTAVVIGPSAHAATTDDACALLTSAQVSAALGVAVGQGTYVTPTFHKTCTWTASTSGGGTVTLYLQSLAGYEGGKKLASLGTSATATPVGGIGDEAYYFNTNQLTSLAVKKGSVALKIAVYARIPVDKQQLIEKELALQVVPSVH